MITTQRVSKLSAAINGTVVREYNLSYTTGDNGYRSLLSSIQENGWDANHQNQATYPATTFAYVSSTTPFIAPAKTPNHVYSSAWVVTDANGDGLNDITDSYTSGGSPGSILVQDNSASFSPSIPDYWATDPYCSGCTDTHMPIERGVRYLDINADGKVDIVGAEYSVVGAGSQLLLEMFRNTYSTSTGYGWTSVASTSYAGVIPNFSEVGGSGLHITTGFFGDVNADGLPDYECAWGGTTCGVTGGVFLANGSAWAAKRTDVFQPWSTFPSGSFSGDYRVVDVNGDGLPDWMFNGNCAGISPVSTCFVLNTGTGWGAVDTHWTIPGEMTIYQSPDLPRPWYERGVRFHDVNGDGLLDWIHSYCAGPFSSTPVARPEIGCFNEMRLNTGYGWTATTSAPFTVHIASTTNGVWNGYFNYDELANWTGDGQQAQDVISTVTYPQGGTATVTYAKTAQDTAITLNPELPFSVLIASRVVTSDGLGTSIQKDYAYAGGQLYRASGVRDRKFAGFATSTEQDGTTITTRYFDQGDTINTSLGEQNDGYGQIAQPFRVDIRKASDNALQTQTFTRWDTASTAAGNTIFVFKAREVTQDYGTAGAHRDTATDYSYSTTTGNVTQITRYGEVTGNSNGTFSDTGSDKSTETISYLITHDPPP